MIKLNMKMEKLLDNSLYQLNDEEINEMTTNIVDKTKLIREGVVYDEYGELEEQKIDFEKIFKYVGDWTGYEINCNELCFDREEISLSDMVIVAQKMREMLSNKYKGRNFIVYVSALEEQIEVRFHCVRSEEIPWLDKNIEKYDIPILYVV